MKHVKKCLSVLFVVSMLICGVVNFTAFAVADNPGGGASEIQPMMASSCGDLSGWYDIDHATKNAILSDVSGNWRGRVGDNPNIYYNSDGTIVLCGTGGYAGRTYVTDLNRSWYI